MIARCIGLRNPERIRLKKGGVALVEFPERTAFGSGRLNGLLGAGQLARMDQRRGRRSSSWPADEEE